VEEKHDVFDLLKKNQPDPVHILGEKTKSSPTGKFAVHVVIGAANSNSLTNPSYGKASSYQGRFEWSPRSYLDMRDMCFISISSRMTCFKRHLSQ
jgi:hypothetical protein